MTQVLNNEELTDKMITEAARVETVLKNELKNVSEGGRALALINIVSYCHNELTERGLIGGSDG
jgi:hypothetical protein